VAPAHTDGQDITAPTLRISERVEGVKKLEKAGSDFIIIACNTVHYFYDQMQNAVNIPILSIVDETVKAAKKERFKRVGILSSESTNKLQIYQNKFIKSGIEALSVTPCQQELLNEVILNIMAGVHGKKDTRSLNVVIESLKKRGAESVILGCTEIPLAIHQDDTEIPLLDSTHIIVEAALKY
jgi:aspartate racemase